MSLLSKKDLDLFDTEWTLKIGSNILLDITKIEAAKWELDSQGNKTALKLKPDLRFEVTAEILSGYKAPHISKGQAMISDTPIGCSWGTNYLRIPYSNLTSSLALLIMGKLEEYEDWCREMSEAWEGVYDIPYQ